MPQNAPPIVLAIAGHDPSGGAGIHADIEAIGANGCTPVTVITCLTVQDSSHVHELHPLDSGLVERSIRTILADLPVRMFKIGLIGSAAIGKTIARLLAEHPEIPMVYDPVLASGAGRALADDGLIEVVRQQLLPRTTILTPNSIEARKIADETDLERAATRLRELGCRNLLITGTHETDTEEVVNRFYRHNGTYIESTWPRLPGEYHGSGCTLASAVAALLARGLPTVDAIEQAQQYAWHSLRQALHTGHGQALPDRLYRTRSQ